MNALRLIKIFARNVRVEIPSTINGVTDLSSVGAIDSNASILLGILNKSINEIVQLNDFQTLLCLRSFVFNKNTSFPTYVDLKELTKETYEFNGVTSSYYPFLKILNSAIYEVSNSGKRLIERVYPTDYFLDKNSTSGSRYIIIGNSIVFTDENYMDGKRVDFIYKTNSAIYGKAFLSTVPTIQSPMRFKSHLTYDDDDYLLSVPLLLEVAEKNYNIAMGLITQPELLSNERFEDRILFDDQKLSPTSL